MADCIAFVTDLFFVGKIRSTAQAVGATLRVARSVDELRAALAAATPDVVMIDMDVQGADPTDAIRTAKEHADRPHVVAFLSHVRADQAEAARQAGADAVMARSAFSARLPEIVGAAAAGIDAIPRE